MRAARLLPDGFEPRPGFDPDRFRDARVARIHYAKSVARWEVERGAQPLRDRTALAEQKVGSAEWLISEMLRFRGEAVVVEPPDLRQRVARRARELLRDRFRHRVRVIDDHELDVAHC
jgi:predicted DNA-binding transcriptional regulator YafY